MVGLRDQFHALCRADDLIFADHPRGIADFFQSFQDEYQIPDSIFQPFDFIDIDNLNALNHSHDPSSDGGDAIEDGGLANSEVMFRPLTGCGGCKVGVCIQESEAAAAVEEGQDKDDQRAGFTLERGDKVDQAMDETRNPDEGEV